MKKLTILAVLVLAVGGCDIPTLVYTNTPTFVDRRPLVPVPDEYAEWYAEVEVCTGMSGDLRSVRWYVAERIVLDGANIGGTLEPPNKITIINSLWEPTVKHEMVHQITGRGNEIHGTPVMEQCA